jgi:uncharacterized protein YndB with AHSA1/START domain
MTKPIKTLEFKVERKIPASVEEVFDGWLDPGIPGTPWNIADKYVLNAKVDGLFFWRRNENSHYGRFTEIKRPGRMQYTWMSPNTSGLESVVTVTFKKEGEETLMTLIHSGLPDTDGGRSHEKGWNYFLNIFPEQFGTASIKKDE